MWVAVVVSLHVGRGWSCRLSANIHDLPHHMEGPVDRLPLMWVKCAVCVGCVGGALGLATGVCVALTLHTLPVLQP